ncbi:unnamed protein product, partial [Musa textilis]
GSLPRSSSGVLLEFVKKFIGSSPELADKLIEVCRKYHREFKSLPGVRWKITENLSEVRRKITHKLARILSKKHLTYWT